MKVVLFPIDFISQKADKQASKIVMPLLNL